MRNALLAIRSYQLIWQLGTNFLHLFIRLKPSRRFIVYINHLNPIPPRISKIAAKRRHRLESILLSNLLTDFGDLSLT